MHLFPASDFIAWFIYKKRRSRLYGWNSYLKPTHRKWV